MGICIRKSEKVIIDFYHKCSEILDIPYECQPFPWTHSKRTRWNNRSPGSGRYPGFGIIRQFGSQYHVAYYEGVKIFNTQKEVFTFLRAYNKRSINKEYD